MLAIEDLLDKTRLPSSGRALVSIILYFPLGLVLALVRFFIGLHTLLVSCILPTSQVRSFVLRPMLGVLGIHVMLTEGQADDKAKILVSNHLSSLDHLVVDLVVAHIMSDDVGLPSIVRWILGYKNLGAQQGKETLIQNVKKYCQESDIPVLFHPERTTTNGRVGLLKFSTLPFGFDYPVQPIAIQATRVPFQIAVTTYDSHWWSDLFWCFFAPYTLFKVKILPVEEKSPSETVQEFTERVRVRMADILKLKTTEYNNADKAEYVKSLMSLPNSSVQPATNPDAQTEDSSATAADVMDWDAYLAANPERGQMIQQVRDVLPDVPLKDIQRDIEVTNDVDATITNILEGKVQSSQEGSIISNSLSHNQSSPVPASQVKFSSSTFGKSVSERQLSFGEKKIIMLETARQRYKEKHGIP